MVLTAVNQDGEALRFASEQLRVDREVVLIAVIQNGRAIQYVSPELREEIKSYDRGADGMLEYYYNLPIDIVELDGTTYKLPGIQNFNSIDEIKTMLKTKRIKSDNFKLVAPGSDDYIRTMDQFVEYLFKLKRGERPTFLLVYGDSDE